MTHTDEEIRYPYGYEAPKFPKELSAARQEEFAATWPVIGLTPNDIRDRKLGYTLEFEPNVNATGSAITCVVSFVHIRLLGWRTHLTATLLNGEKMTVDQPRFHVVRNSTTIFLENGIPILLGTSPEPAPDKGYELVVLKVTAQKAFEQ